jgi:hypothetical protein
VGLFLVLTSTVINAGCFATGSKAHFMDSGVKKAAFDMHCAEDQLEVTSLAGGSVGVRGCGKQSRYEYVSGTGWVLNAAEERK